MVAILILASITTIASAIAAATQIYMIVQYKRAVQVYDSQKAKKIAEEVSRRTDRSGPVFR